MSSHNLTEVAGTESASRLRVKARGLSVERRLTVAGTHPFDLVDWEERTAAIAGENGEMVFEQKGVEVPKSWSPLAANVVASKYFHGRVGSSGRETSLKQVITRVASTIARWGREQGYFASEEDAAVYEAELIHLILHQYMAFNSPVWFNCGIEARPQCSACFINSVEDTMASILGLAKTEGMLFKWGSGAGTNFSALRSSKENLSGGGTASGPVSFMRGYDSFAGVIKSGGKTRRAAKMVILNISHPDIVEFITSKSEEEKKAWVLIENGYDGGFNVAGGAYDSVQFQNANHSVRVTDEFMRAVVEDREWQTRAVTTGDVVGTFRARDLMRMIGESTHICGDPGIQFDTMVNDWNTCLNSGRINASNPCSEYMFLDDSACNLASLNLMKFRKSDGEFDIPAFRHAVHLTVIAQEIIVNNASYPTKPIEKNSLEFRALGLGYANLGALLMARGLPYDNDEGRDYAAAVTALMHGQAYATSAQIARNHGGAFPAFEKNREPMLRVVQKHRAALGKINPQRVPEDLMASLREVWQEAYTLGVDYGYRNAQVTLLAPTGTIGFMMDCDTTGVEPDIALVKYKKLVGGGVLKIINQTVPLALQKLGYPEDQARAILDHIDKQETIEGAPFLKEEHLPVFDCAFKPAKGQRSIHYMGHIRMMSAVQPFLSGAISKTVNLPTEATVDDVIQTYLEAWKLGLKAIAVYRDGSKRTQPLTTSRDVKGKGVVAAGRLERRHLPDERRAITHKFSIAGHEGYITVGMYEDGSPGEIFIVMSKEGTVVSGLVDSFATAISLALQYGVPIKVLVSKFTHTRFEPSGITTNPEIRFASSIVDYIFRWMSLKFLTNEETAKAAEGKVIVPTAKPEAASSKPAEVRTETGTGGRIESARGYVLQIDAPPCPECGSMMVRNGACYKCVNCGATSGCS
ncbi:MAG: vitamin B12-dependent ribonucleotide reductase [Planctomycetota bacterium]